MRIIFIVLLIINIGFLIFNLNKEPQELSNIDRKEHNIVLYSESNEDHRIEKSPDSLVRPDKEKSSQKVEEHTTNTALQINEDDKVIERLFSEVDLQSKTIINNQSQFQKSESGEEYNCFILGPTLHTKKLQTLKNKIRDKYSTVFFSIFEQKGTTYYRIYIPPLKSISDIRVAQKLLSENNLSDHYVMNQGDKKNAIALGVFRIKKITDNIAKKVNDLGYQVVVEPILEAEKIQYFLKIHTSKESPRIKLEQQELDTDLEIEACKKN